MKFSELFGDKNTPAALLMDVRSELGPSLSFLYVAGRWV